MNSKISIVLTAPPSMAHAASRFNLPLAHMAYRVGPGLRLLRGAVRTSTRDAYMTLSDTQYLEQGGSPALLAREVAGECLENGFRGVVADFSGAPCAGLSAFIREAAQTLSDNRLTLYVSGAYVQLSAQTTVLISSNVTGGSLRARLEESVAAYGLGRVALDVGRLCHDFMLPAPGPEGKKLEPKELSGLIDRLRPMSFYSNELCANYFTYRDTDGGMHFVVYDNAHTIAKKLYTAQLLGVREAFLLYPEIEELLDDILSHI